MHWLSRIPHLSAAFILADRLHGLSEIRDIVELCQAAQDEEHGVEAGGSGGRHNNSSGNGGGRRGAGGGARAAARWINPEFLVGWLKEKRIIDMRFGANAHIELTKIGVDLFVFLADNEALDEEDLERFWRSSVGAHESLKARRRPGGGCACACVWNCIVRRLEGGCVDYQCSHHA